MKPGVGAGDLARPRRVPLGSCQIAGIAEL